MLHILRFACVLQPVIDKLHTKDIREIQDRSINLAGHVMMRWIRHVQAL